MKLFNLFTKFRNDEEGAVTVDWVVLTAAVVGLGILAISVIGPAISTKVNGISTELGKSVTSSGTVTGG